METIPDMRGTKFMHAAEAWAAAWERADEVLARSKAKGERAFRSLPNRPEVSIPGPSTIPQHGST